MAEREFDESNGLAGYDGRTPPHHPAAQAPRPAGGMGAGPPMGPQPASGPAADWLHEASGWGPRAPFPGPPGSPFAGAPAGTPSAWVAPPPLEPDEAPGRWSWSGAAPWVVAGLLCAVLLTGRDTAPAAAPAPEHALAEPSASGPAAVTGSAAAPAAAADPSLAPVACPGVTP